ncbi:MAG: signal recognition particle-docking protein FtsY, partial [Cyanobacteria bacterium J06626_14]
MAPFNWFSRDSKTPAQTEDPSPSNEEAIPASNPQSSDDNTQSGASADDYLSWAKAAYQNIQQQKQQSQDTAPASSEEPSEATTTQEAPSLD